MAFGKVKCLIFDRFLKRLTFPKITLFNLRLPKSETLKSMEEQVDGISPALVWACFCPISKIALPDLSFVLN